PDTGWAGGFASVTACAQGVRARRPEDPGRVGQPAQVDLAALDGLAVGLVLALGLVLAAGLVGVGTLGDLQADGGQVALAALGPDRAVEPDELPAGALIGREGHPSSEDPGRVGQPAQVDLAALDGLAVGLVLALGLVLAAGLVGVGTLGDLQADGGQVALAALGPDRAVEPDELPAGALIGREGHP